MSIELMWPLSIDGTGGFTFTEDPATRIRKHVLSALATEPGERVMNVTYGAGAARYVYDSLDEPESESLREAVLDALTRLVPEVDITDVLIDADEALGRFVVSVRYTLANGLEGNAQVNVGESGATAA